MDVHSPDQRSYNMSRIKNKDTKPEIIVRKLIFSLGYRYRLYKKGLQCKPDIIFPGKRKVIFVNGCFWHKHTCKFFKWPATNSEFWKKKISDNVRRDRKNYRTLTKEGWKYLVIWECEIKDKKALEKSIITFLH